MDINKIIKNPVLIGLIAGILSYFYLKWKNDKKKNIKSNKKKINLIIPLFISIVFWFISYAYFSLDEDEMNPSTNALITQANNIIEKTKTEKNSILTKISSDTSEPHSFNLISNGVQIPTNLPDILFEMK
jgi:hypothetical protein